MHTQPDSALTILQKLHEIPLPQGALQARYALLYTQALDKNGLPLLTDSLISIAVDYYSRKKEWRKSGWAWLYLGNAYMQMENITLAMHAYLKTQEQLQRVNDDYLLGLVTNEMALLYQDQFYYEEALSLFQKSLRAFQRSGNRKNEGYMFMQIADLLYISGSHIDSVQSYYNRAKEIAKERGDTEFLYTLSISDAVMLRAQKEYHRAKQQLLATIQEYKEGIIPPECYSLLSSLYIDMHHIDSARYYMLLVLSDAQATAKQRVTALGALKEIEEQAGNVYSALHWASQHKALTDSILLSLHKHDIRVTESRHHIEKLTLEKISQKTGFIAFITGLVVLSIASLYAIRYGWKRRLERQKEQQAVAIAQQEDAVREFKRSSLSERWNPALFLKEFTSGVIYRTEEHFYAKVMSAAKRTYPGFTTQLKNLYPSLNESDVVITCLLFSGLKPKEICSFYTVWNPYSIHTRCSRLYQKLNIKIDRKDPVPFRERLLDLFVTQNN